MSRVLTIKSATTNKEISLSGHLVDDHTRCEHYHSTLDIIALKFKCCNTYYPCYQCHPKTHPIIKFTQEEIQNDKLFVVLCGNCYNELSFNHYSGNGEYKCRCCESKFNPGCSLHYDLYFDISKKDGSVKCVL